MVRRRGEEACGEEAGCGKEEGCGEEEVYE